MRERQVANAPESMNSITNPAAHGHTWRQLMELWDPSVVLCAVRHAAATQALFQAWSALAALQRSHALPPCHSADTAHQDSHKHIDHHSSASIHNNQMCRQHTLVPRQSTALTASSAVPTPPSASQRAWAQPSHSTAAAGSAETAGSPAQCMHPAGRHPMLHGTAASQHARCCAWC